MKPSTWCSPVRVSARGAHSPAPDGAAPASRASVRNVFEVATARSQPHLGRASARPASSVLSTYSCSSSTCVDGGGVVASRSTPSRSRVSRPGAERQRHRDVRRPRRCRPRSPASRHRCRAPAAARPTSRTSGARRGTSCRASSSPESTCSSTPVSVAHPAPAPRPSSWRRVPPTWRTPAGRRRAACARPPCAPRRPPRPARRRRPRSARRRGRSARPGAARPSPSAPATGARRGGRPPPAGARCWSRRRAHPAACE